MKRRNIITLSDEDRKKLEQTVRKLSSEQRSVLRASIILSLANGRSVEQTAQDLNTSPKTVKKWRKRFLKFGLDGLKDLPRSGAPGKFNIEQRLSVLATACDSPSNYGIKGCNHWTLGLLTEVINKKDIPMGCTSVFRTLNCVDLKPHKHQMWLHSPDPEFKEKVNIIVPYYLNPPEPGTVVLCTDEKTGMQATERKYETKTALPGQPARYESEYIRHGTQSLIGSFNVHSSKVTATCGNTRKAQDLLDHMEQVAIEYKEAKKIIIIWDNLNIHKDGTDKRWTEFNKRHANKFEFIYTPLHASWVNQVEVFFSILHKGCLRYGSFKSIDELKKAVLDLIQRWNEETGHPFNWKFKGYPLTDGNEKVA